jgi:biopolymer transport protein ExbD
LPKGHAQEGKKVSNEDITIYIDKDEQIFINTVSISQEDFIAALEKKLEERKEQQVFVNADKAISYGTLMQVVDSIKYLAGVEDVILATEKA